MSVKVSSWVWEHSPVGGSERLVLLAIADCAADDGTNAWPSVATLARKCRVDERTVQRIIRRLSDGGHLVVEASAGGRGSNRYAVVMSRPSSEEEEAKPAEISAECDPRQDATGGKMPPRQDAGAAVAQSCHPNVLEPSKKNSSSSKKSSSEGKRGTRIPADFAITEPMRAWAFAEAAERGGREPDRARLDVWLDRWTAEFIDYWAARSGQAATKIDWVATWRNRMRTKIGELSERVTQPGDRYGTRASPNGAYQGTSDRKVDQVDIAYASMQAKMQRQNGAIT